MPSRILLPDALFQSTLSMRRATRAVTLDTVIALSISIHALHEESDVVDRMRGEGRVISIHALHEESDSNLQPVSAHGRISIHALHEESDRKPDHGEHRHSQFQSTLSMRRATRNMYFYAT